LDNFDPGMPENEPIPKEEGLWKSSASVQEFLDRFKEKYPKIWAKFGWESSR
jgi:hypothetical protein